METPSKFDALKKFGNNLFTFFSGISLGLLVGVGVTFYYLDSKIENTLNRENESKNQIGLISKFLDFAQKTNPFAHKDKAADSLKISKAEIKGNDSKKFEKDVKDSLASIAIADSSATVSSDDLLEEDGLVVKKDEMIFSKYMEISEAGRAGNNADSANAFGTRTKQIVGRMWVEFWRSPLNYRGYKYGRSKLVVYGIDDYESVKLIKRSDELYLRHNTTYFRINNADSFVPFARVNDDITLIELNQF